MFSMKDLIGEALKNYPGGSANFDEEVQEAPEEAMEMPDDESPMLPFSQLRQINRSPFGASMDAERKMR